MFVISRNTAFTYRNRPVDAKQIGRDLGVRYVLEGSVRRSGNQVRVNTQLIDAETDAHLWAERFDRDIADLLSVQNEITNRIATALNLELVAAEARRPTEHPDALDYILRGRAIGNKGITPEVYAEAIAMYEHALATEPRSVEARTHLGQALASRVLSGMSNSRVSDIARAKALIEEAIAMSPRSTFAHFAKGQLLRAEGRCDEAISEFEMVVASNPNNAGAFFALGVCKLATGSIDETIPLEEQAIRLSPRDPVVFNRYLVIGQVQLLQSHIDEAIVWLERARTANSVSQFPHALLASAYGLKGDRVRAAAELAEARRLSSDDRYSNLARLKARPWGVPKIRSMYEATFFTGLRKAGMPEE
jgi:tetratricopeptide (TPR) repeat protein